MRRVLTVAAMAAAALALSAGGALASPIDVFKIPDAVKDGFLHMLSGIMPNAGGVTGSTEFSGSPMYAGLKASFGLFNGGLLLLASAFFAYQIIAGTVAAAKEGTELGRKYHQVWAPIRIVLGLGFLTPIAGGLSSAQFLIVLLAGLSGGMANATWSAYVDQALRAEYSTNSGQQNAVDTAKIAASTIANSTIKGVFEHELCYSVLKLWTLRNGGTVTAPGWSDGWVSDTKTLDYGPACGKIVIKVPAMPNPKSVSSQVGSWWNRAVPFSNTSAEVEKYTGAIIGKAQYEAVNAERQKLSALADEVAQTYIVTTGNQAKFFDPGGAADRRGLDVFTAARQDYMGKMATAAANAFSYVNDNSSIGRDFIESARQQTKDLGWIYAGTFWNSMTRVDNAVYSYMQTGATFTDFSDGSLGRRSQTIWDWMVGNPSDPGVIAAFREWYKVHLEDIAKGDVSTAAINVGANGSETSVYNEFYVWVIESFTDKGTTPINAIGNDVAFGNKLMSWGGSLLAVSKAAEIGAGAINGVAPSVGPAGALKGAFQTLVAQGASLALMVAGSLIVAGICFAIVIPLLPYFYSMAFATRFLITFCEALAASSLWAFSHVRIDGQEAIDGAQAAGYRLAFHILFQPLLFVLGLIMSVMVYGMISGLIDATFMPMVKGMAGTASWGPIGVIVMIITFTWMKFHFAMGSFRLLTHLPEHVMSWIGFQGPHAQAIDAPDRAHGMIFGTTQSAVRNAAQMGGSGRGFGKSPQGEPPKPNNGGAKFDPAEKNRSLKTEDLE